ncbi:MAG: nitroreductase family protein [Anaerolineales bacterium]|jgi:nitroreductase
MLETMENDILFRAILARRSVRRYDPKPLDTSMLDRVTELIHGLEPLVAENDFQVVFRDGLRLDAQFMQGVGAYGRIISAPHALAPYVVGPKRPLLDCGYRTQQLVVRMTALGLATCYVGTLGREERSKAALDLPAASRCAAILVFGHAATSAGGRAVNAIIRGIAKGGWGTRDKAVFFHNSFDNPGEPPEFLEPLIVAALASPSAVDARPWRFLYREGAVHVFLLRHNLRYGRGVGQEYRYYDGGICMANIALAMEALPIEGRWSLEIEDGDIDHPASLEWLTALHLSY